MKRFQLPLFALLFATVLAGCTFVTEEYYDDTDAEPRIVTFLVEYDADDLSYDQEIAFAEFDAPEITADVHDYGAVLAFYEIDGTWFGMPFTNGYDFDQDGVTDEVIEFTYASDPGDFVLYFITSGAELFPEDVLEGRVKVAVIPPDYTNFNKQRMQFKTWDEAKAALGLEEPTVVR